MCHGFEDKCQAACADCRMHMTAASIYSHKGCGIVVVHHQQHVGLQLGLPVWLGVAAALIPAIAWVWLGVRVELVAPLGQVVARV